MNAKLAVVLGLLAALVAGGVGVAYWTSGGSGSGSAATGSAAAVTVTQSVSPTGLFPASSVALSGKFDNPNSGSVFITAVTATVGTFSVQSNVSKPACTQADFTITGTAPVNASIAAGNGVGSWSGLSLNMTNSGTNQDNCQNVTVPISYTES